MVIHFLFPLFAIELLQVSALKSIFSPLSGIVLPGELGSQSVQLGLNFASSRLFVFSERVCPPFIGRCYQFDASPSGSILPGDCLVDHAVVADIFDGPTPCLDYGELFGDLSSKWRDVHGLIGAGPQSEFFRGSLLEIAENEDISRRGATASVRRLADVEDVIGHRFAYVDHIHTWTVDAFLLLNGEILDEDVEIDSGSSDILLPTSLLTHEEFVGINRDENDRILTDCESDDLMFHLKSPQGGFVALGSQILQMAELRFHTMSLGEEFVTVCPVRVRFSSEVEAIVIGRALIRSVDRLVFDYRPESLGIIMTPRLGGVSRVSPFMHPQLRIPYYSGLELIIRRSSEALLPASPASYTLQYILYSKRPHRMDEWTDCWTFIKLPWPADQRSFTIYTSEAFVLSAVTLSVNEEDKSIAWIPVEEGSLQAKTRISLREMPSYSQICAKKIVQQPDPNLVLPAPIRVDDASRDCAICLSELVGDVLVQPMPYCKHEFHPACIRQWANIQDSCPICRSRVRVKPTPSTTSPVPSTFRTNRNPLSACIIC
jgi:hypothetical protein